MGATVAISYKVAPFWCLLNPRWVDLGVIDGNRKITSWSKKGHQVYYVIAKEMLLFAKVFAQVLY
jgi:hypothetical protein